MHKLATIILLGGAMLGLSGCYVAPAPGYYRGGYAAPGYYRGGYAAPAYYRAPRYGYGGYGYGYRPYGYAR